MVATFFRRFPPAAFLLDRLSPSTSRQTIQRLESYPVRARSRWTKEAPHPEILRVLRKHTARYAENLQTFRALRSSLDAIPFQPEPDEPHWNNDSIPALDALALYCFTALQNPDRYIEIGSGNSTRFVRRAIRDQRLGTRITSIDPQPRAEIAALCDESMRTGLESADLSFVSRLTPGDIVYVDTSHRALMSSDVTVFFLEVLPRLPRGVLVGIHHTFWPEDYPAQWADRSYSEQYLLGQVLLQRPALQIELPAHYLSVFNAKEYEAHLDPLWPQVQGPLARHGCSFWFRIL